MTAAMTEEERAAVDFTPAINRILTRAENDLQELADFIADNAGPKCPRCDHQEGDDEPSPRHTEGAEALAELRASNMRLTQENHDLKQELDAVHRLLVRATGDSDRLRHLLSQTRTRELTAPLGDDSNDIVVLADRIRQIVAHTYALPSTTKETRNADRPRVAH